MRNKATDKKYPFPGERRLRKRNDFLLFSTQKNYRSYGTYLSLKATRGSNGAKFAFITTKKLGKAHYRNKVKRILREIIRLNPEICVEGFYYIIFVNNDLEEKKSKLFPILDKELTTLLVNVKKKIEQSERPA